MATPNKDKTQTTPDLPQEEQALEDLPQGTGVTGQKIAIASAVTLVAEPVLALAHAGGVGVLVGLAVGGFTYWLCDEYEQSSGKEISFPGASAIKKRPKTPGQHSLFYRMLNGKSARGENGSEQNDQPEQENASSPARNYYLDLAPDFRPHVNDILGHAILGIGQRGTGKSNLAARLIEQLGEHPIPMFVGDYKGDYTTLPEILKRCVIAGAPDWPGQKECDIYWRITKQNAEHAGALIMERGVQLVFECLTYDSLDEACEVMTSVIKGMFDWSLKQPIDQRIPALVLLDEAQQFLPQNQGDSRINKELSNQLFLMFEKLNSVGRSFGFTPAFFTQRIAQIRKEVIGGSELFFLMRQTLPLDLREYEKIIGKDENEKWLLDRRIAQRLEQGYGIVFRDGEFFVTHFKKRGSTHNNITPELEDAIAFYESRSGAPLHMDEMEPLPSKTHQPSTPPSEQPRSAPVRQEQVAQQTPQSTARPRLALVREETPAPVSTPARQPMARRIPGIPMELQQAAQVFQPGMSTADLARALNCSPGEARIYRQELRKYARVLERQAPAYQLVAVANGGSVATAYEEHQTAQVAASGLPADDSEEQPSLIKLGIDNATRKDVTITQEEFRIAVRLRKTGRSTGYRDLMGTFDLGETHAKALNRLINKELGVENERVSE
jgi:hypothetical protein